MTYLQAIISCHLLTTSVETAIVNVALNQQSWQSSTDYLWNASRANDGFRTNNEGMNSNSCTHTNGSGHYTAWWQVDLGQNYNISHILLTTRNWPGGPGRIAGFSVFVSVTKKQKWQSQELCYRDSNPQLMPAYGRRINCTNMIIGRYVVVYNKRPVDNPSIGFQYSQTAILELCEVDVPVEILNCGNSLCSSCNNGWYGQRCENPCENCGGEQRCNKESGVCLSQSCRTGFYGLYCSHSCPFNCGEDGSCDFSTGYCNHCPGGKYGQSCEFDCPVGCRTCENITLCYTCNEEFYGSICSKTCPGCGGNGSCSKSNGTCLSPSCRPRYYGNNSRCDQVCPSNCAGDKSCHYASGECVHGCTRGFYGQLCSKVCPENCGGDGSCNKGSGDCSNGCNPGWNGTGCDSKCGNGTFGLNCSQKCGRCKSNVCDNVYGTCHLGCESGWSNIRCNTETQQDTGKLHAAVIEGVLGALLFILLGIILNVAIFRWRQTRKKKGNMYMSQADNSVSEDRAYSSVQRTFGHSGNTSTEQASSNVGNDSCYEEVTTTDVPYINTTFSNIVS